MRSAAALFAALLVSACGTQAPWLLQPPADRTAGIVGMTCEQQARINSWTDDCLAWQQRKDAENEAARRAKDRAREEQATTLRAQQAQEQQAAMQRERAAIAEDARNGYRQMSFEEFALDAPGLKSGARVVMRGLYMSEGRRLVRDQLSAARWYQAREGGEGVVIPLDTEGATRAARATLLHCGSVLGCPVVVRGRVEVLLMSNRLGGRWEERGIAVEDVR